MRYDEFGLFWNDVQVGKTQRPKPPIPKSEWKRPTSFPNLTTAKTISFDLETYDPELLDNGAGWARNKGHIIGISVATDGYKGYFPIRHEEQVDLNFAPEHVLSWCKSFMEDPKISKVGANITYDIGWLRQEGVHVKGELHDVQFAEAILSSGSLVNLETLGQKYLNEGKDSNQLYYWLADYCGGKPTQAQRKHMYLAPITLAGLYAESDADLPLRILRKQWDLFTPELYNVYRMECDLIPLMIEMRFNGVSVNLSKAFDVRQQLVDDVLKAHTSLNNELNMVVNVNSGKSLELVFNKIGIAYPITDKGNASFTKSWLNTIKHPVVDRILNIRKWQTLISTFIDGAILSSNVDGKVYGSFNQLKGDEGGAITGRFSSNSPNLQNIPARDDLGELVRSIFVPDEEHKHWVKIDYSQIEYRCLAHFAKGQYGHIIRDMYNNDKNTDFHSATQALVKKETGLIIDRKPIKNINFGLTYGMGKAKLAESIKKPLKEAEHLFDAYHKSVPFVKDTMQFFSKQVENLGYVETVMGRKTTFDTWQPISFKDTQATSPVSYQEALRYWGSDIKRAYSYKGLNYVLQGSASDIMKMAMLRAYQSGIFDTIGYPRLTVHDELDFSIGDYNVTDWKELIHILENSTPMSVPIIAEAEIGTDWGNVHKWDL